MARHPRPAPRQRLLQRPWPSPPRLLSSPPAPAEGLRWGLPHRTRRRRSAGASSALPSPRERARRTFMPPNVAGRALASGSRVAQRPRIPDPSGRGRCDTPQIGMSSDRATPRERRHEPSGHQAGRRRYSSCSRNCALPGGARLAHEHPVAADAGPDPPLVRGDVLGNEW